MEFKVVYLNQFIKFYGTEISVSMEKGIVEAAEYNFKKCFIIKCTMNKTTDTEC